MFATNYLTLVSASFCTKYENTSEPTGNEAREGSTTFPSVN